MIASRTRELRKIKRNLDGIRNMTKMPGAMIVIDVAREHNAVKEARKAGIPTICLIDTDSNPGYADIPIPGNDDSMRSIDLVIKMLADAAAEGLKARATMKEEAPAAQQEAPRPRRRFSENRPAPAADQPTGSDVEPAGIGADGTGGPAAGGSA